MANWIVIAAAAGIIVWGTTTVGHGIAWTWRQKTCIIKHGVRYCRAKDAVKNLGSPPVEGQGKR